MARFSCSVCKYDTNHLGCWRRHCSSKKHLLSTDKNNESYLDFKHACPACSYGTNSPESFSSHCRTARHIKLETEETPWKCDGCERFFRSSKAHSFHKKSCTFIPPEPSQPSQPSQPNSEPLQPNSEPLQPQSQQPDMMTMVQMLMQTVQSQSTQNQQLIEAISSGNLANNTTNNTDNSTTNNTQHNTMNLNVFLDEHCKDAMNLTDFFDKIKVHQ